MRMRAWSLRGSLSCLVVGCLCLTTLSIASAADEKSDDRAITVADGHLTFKAPAGWEKKTPKSRIIEVEYAIPAVDGDENPGRLTIMGAGGDIEANIDRWIGQFVQPDGSDTKKAAKVEKLKVNGVDVHYVDIAGTYKDMVGGPFAGGKTVSREDYRMLAAIVQTKKAGNYFLKFYGPKATVAKNEKAFKDLVDSLQTK